MVDASGASPPLEAFFFASGVSIVEQGERAMEREKRIQMNMRVQPWVRDARRVSAGNAHGHGAFLAKAIAASITHLQQTEYGNRVIAQAQEGK